MKPDYKALVSILPLIIGLGVLVWAAVPADTLWTSPGGDTVHVVDYVNATIWAQSPLAFFGTVNTGFGDNELYGMNQNVTTTSAVAFATVNTGQGDNELYDMNQDVLTTSSPEFVNLTLSGDCLNGYNVTNMLQYPESAHSYILWTDGTNYYAKNGTTGEIEYAGNSFTTAFQYGIDNSPASGGKVWVGPGTHISTATISIEKSIWIEGSGEDITFLKLCDGADFSFFSIGATTSNARGLTFTDFHLDGNKANVVATTHGFNVSRTRNLKLERVYTWNFVGDGMHIEPIDENIVDLVFSHSVFEGCEDRGIYAEAIFADGNHIERFFMNNAYIYGNRIGVELNGSNIYSWFFNGIEIANSDEEGMILRGTRDGSYMGGGIYNNNQDLAAHCELMLTAETGGGTVTRAYFSTDLKGPRTGGAVASVETTENGNEATFVGCWFAATPFAGAGNKSQIFCRNCENAKTEAHGSQTILSGTNSITFNHGMIDDPVFVGVTGQHEETRDLIVTMISSTQIKVQTGDGVNVTADRNFYWYATSYRPAPFGP